MGSLRKLLSGRTSLIVIIALSMALGASLAVNFTQHETAAYAIDRDTVTLQQRAALRELEGAFISIVDGVLPSVVSITSKRTVEARAPGLGDDFFKGFPFPFPMPEVPDAPKSRDAESYGSGVIIRSDGYILTNDHVVGGADKVLVKLKDGREFDGKVSRDPRSDLAVIKIEAGNLPAIKIGDSSRVKVGSWAIAVGSPFGLDQTVTLGVVSATGRQEAIAGSGEPRFYPNLIQTDASINPGNSGGPLVNIDGELIGINTLIRSSMGGNVGIGFAIPANTAKFVLDQLIEHGKVTRGFLGIRPTDLSPKTASRYGVKDGALVVEVEVGSPADKAGVQVEDVVVEFDGNKISSEIELRDTIAATPPGKQAKMVVVRDKARKTLNVTVGELQATEVAESPKGSVNKLGFSVANITPELAQKYKLEDGTRGVVVTTVVPGSSAMREGIQPGMVIVRANDQPVSTVTEFENATRDAESGDTLLLVIQMKERRILVEIPVD